MSDLIYWIAMVLIVGASIALLTGTFLSIRKNKREKNKKTGRVAAYADDYEEDEEDERELPRRRGSAQEVRRPQSQPERKNEKKQWKNYFGEFGYLGKTQLYFLRYNCDWTWE